MLLLQHGHVARVTAAAEAWARFADPSLVRYFVFKVLSVCGPPYSPPFASAVVSLMMLAGVKRSRSGQRDSARVELLAEFAAGCARVDFDPPLPAKQRAFLQELQTERSIFD